MPGKGEEKTTFEWRRSCQVIAQQADGKVKGAPYLRKEQWAWRVENYEEHPPENCSR